MIDQSDPGAKPHGHTRRLVLNRIDFIRHPGIQVLHPAQV